MRDNNVDWSVAFLYVELLASFDRETKAINRKMKYINRDRNIWMDGGPTTSCITQNTRTNKQMPKGTTQVVPLGTISPNKEILANALQAHVLPGFVVGWLGELLSALFLHLLLLDCAKQTINDDAIRDFLFALEICLSMLGSVKNPE